MVDDFCIIYSEFAYYKAKEPFYEITSVLVKWAHGFKIGPLAEFCWHLPSHPFVAVFCHHHSHHHHDHHRPHH